MTFQEVKEYMENEIRCIQRASHCDRDCAKCELVKEEEPLLEAFYLAIKTLEKHNEKRPLYIDVIIDRHGYHLSFICPTCNEEFYDEPYRPNYCKHCSQKLDWSNENE